MYEIGWFRQEFRINSRHQGSREFCTGSYPHQSKFQMPRKSSNKILGIVDALDQYKYICLIFRLSYLARYFYLELKFFSCEIQCFPWIFHRWKSYFYVYNSVRTNTFPSIITNYIVSMYVYFGCYSFAWIVLKYLCEEKCVFRWKT